MSELLKVDKNYALWIELLSKNFKKMQIKAAVSVNSEMLKFYFEIGKGISERIKNSKYGDNFYEKLSADLCAKIPNVKSFSPRNLRYMQSFYATFSDISILPQVGADSTNILNMPQNDAKLGIKDAIYFNIPWGHIKAILDKYKNNAEKALFYVNKTIENNWSRAVLLNFIDTNLYEREGKAISNFKYKLPESDSDLAQSITKDPYNFDFLTIRENYDEKELKDALMDNIQKFLLELGTGFAFVGREYRLKVGDTEQFLDMLFYNIKLHCYVVIEVKITEFKPSAIGQLGTYIVAVDHELRKEIDAKTIGLLICKTKDSVLAKYALESSGEPIGISEYEISNALPKEFKGSMPTIEELENELSK